VYDFGASIPRAARTGTNPGKKRKFLFAGWTGGGQDATQPKHVQPPPVGRLSGAKKSPGTNLQRPLSRVQKEGKVAGPWAKGSDERLPDQQARHRGPPRNPRTWVETVENEKRIKAPQHRNHDGPGEKARENRGEQQKNGGGKRETNLACSNEKGVKVSGCGGLPNLSWENNSHSKRFEKGKTRKMKDASANSSIA